ncbi:MAG TPA: PspC domain-containing protein, partial [Leifsonia sp.]
MTPRASDGSARVPHAPWTPPRARPPARPVARPPLARPRRCVLSGVSVALADHLGWPLGTVRALFVATSLLGGAGLLFYLWLWALTPLRPARPDDGDAVERRIPVPWLLAALAGAAGVAAIGLAAADEPPSGALGCVAAMIALGVGAVAWDQLVDEPAGDRAAERSPSAARAPLALTAGTPLRIGVGVYLVVIALLLTAIPYRAGSGWLWLGVIAATFAGAAVLVAPWALRLSRELISERTARIKQEQRAEIAAHLHDSVLQTLALIQNRAGASSEVARIARAQERELREWLYAEDGAAADPLTGD